MDSSIHWQKSSFSGVEANNNCLELAHLAQGPALRESEDPGTVLTTTRARPAALLAAVSRGRTSRR